MGHEIDLKKYQVRTDLAIDVVKEEGHAVVENVDKIKVTTFDIDATYGEKIGKKAGNYVTIEFEDVTDYENRKKVIAVFSQKLKMLLEKSGIKENMLGMIIGLGNAKSTPDALGPLAADQVLVTNHLAMLSDLEDGFMRTVVLKPGVMGENGMETSTMIEGVVSKIQPDFLIVIDALASQSIDRVNRAIQMTDTGIHPGSGVGNSRKEISRENMKIPVIAIGIATVVDAVTIVSDTIHYMQHHFSYMKKNMNQPKNRLVPLMHLNYLKEEVEIKKEDKEELLGMIGSLEEAEVKQLIFEVLTPIGYNLMVTPKEVDYMIEKLSEVIGEGINRTLHKKMQ